MEWILISIVISLSYLLFSKTSSRRDYKAEAMFMEVQAKYGHLYYQSETYQAYLKFMNSTQKSLFDRNNWVSKPSGLDFSIFDVLIKEYEYNLVKPTQLLLPQFCETQEYIYEPSKPI